MPFVQGLLDRDGRRKATIGAGGQKTIMSEPLWVDVFNAAGLPAAFEPDSAALQEPVDRWRGRLSTGEDRL